MPKCGWEALPLRRQNVHQLNASNVRHQGGATSTTVSFEAVILLLLIILHLGFRNVGDRALHLS